MVLGQHGGVGRAEGTENWSAEGRNAILVTRAGWDREELGPGAAVSFVLRKKTPGFKPEIENYCLGFFVNFSGSSAPGSAVAHVHDSFLVTGTVPEPCPQTKAVREQW